MARPKKTTLKKTNDSLVQLQEVIPEKVAVVDKSPLPAKNDIDIDAITKSITKIVTDKLTADFNNKLDSAIAALSKSTEQRRDRIVLTGEKQYFVEATNDGLEFNKDSDTVLLIGKNGQLASGTRAPKTYGKGSAHFKAGASSEAVLPTSGTGATRGVIVEGEGDDDKTFVFRAVSRMNRQGFNIFSDGSVALGSMSKIKNSTLGVYHRHPTDDAFVISVPSLQYEDSVINLDVSAAPSDNWSTLTVNANGDEVFKIGGLGTIYSNSSLYTNSRGYAEMFEWADNNNRKEDRKGFTVAFDKTGKLVSADEGDNVVGVVVADAAVVGNAGWSNIPDKYNKNESTEFNIVEWLEIETSTLKSFDKTTLSSSFVMPENAVEIQSDKNGNSFSKFRHNPNYDKNKEYVSRLSKHSWATVCVLGVAPVYKGQQMGKNWIKIRDLNDELDLWLIR